MRKVRIPGFPRTGAALALATGVAILAAGPVRPAAADDCPDAAITADVKARIMGRHPIAGLKINIETDECVVTLKGCYDSAAVARRAVSSARKVKKVRGVKNEMKPCPND